MTTGSQGSAPLCCPICGERDVDRVLQDLQITARGPADEKKVTGLAAFVCTLNRHVFFIRYFDLSFGSSQ